MSLGSNNPVSMPPAAAASIAVASHAAQLAAKAKVVSSSSLASATRKGQPLNPRPEDEYTHEAEAVQAGGAIRPLADPSQEDAREDTQARDDGEHHTPLDVSG